MNIPYIKFMYTEFTSLLLLFKYIQNRKEKKNLYVQYTNLAEKLGCEVGLFSTLFHFYFLLFFISSTLAAIFFHYKIYIKQTVWEKFWKGCRCFSWKAKCNKMVTKHTKNFSVGIFFNNTQQIKLNHS